MRLSDTDLHIHTSVSDGTAAPERVPGLVRAAGISLFSVTDHDAVNGCLRAMKAGRKSGLRLVTGAEFSTKDEEGKYHILGYAFDPDSACMTDLFGKCHAIRMGKLEKRLQILAGMGITFPRDELKKLRSLDNPGKPHLGNLMAECGYVDSKDEAIRKYLNGMEIEHSYNSPQEVIAAITEAGGVPVLAHPCFGDGDQLIEGEQLRKRVARLREMGILGVEGFYSKYTEAQRAEILALASELGMYVTAGSDWHGGNKKEITLGFTGLGDERPEGFEKFLKDINDRVFVL